MNSVQASVALKRIDKFMNSEELKETVEVIKEQNGHSNGAGQDSKNSIEIDGGVFQWEANQDKPTLDGINLKVAKGSLTAIVGTVGCGKSSLLSSILGELDKKIRTS